MAFKPKMEQAMRIANHSVETAFARDVIAAMQSSGYTPTLKQQVVSKLVGVPGDDYQQIMVRNIAISVGLISAIVSVAVKKGVLKDEDVIKFVGDMGIIAIAMHEGDGNRD